MSLYTKTRKLIKRLNGPNSIFYAAYRKQLFATLTVCINCLSHGLTIGWSAPTLLNIMSENTPLDFPVTVYEISWIGSMHEFGAIFGDLIQCFLVNIFGRKLCISIMSAPQILAWLLIYFAKSVEYLYIARVLLGFAVAASFAIMPMYLAEISNKNVRGTFMSFGILAINLGTLSGLILTSALSYHIFPWIAILIPILFQIAFVYFPETPHYLLKKGLEDAAFKSFQSYGNYENDLDTCQTDFNELRSANNDAKLNKKFYFRDFVKTSALESYATILVLLLLMHFCGLYTLMNYMSEIFSISGAPFDPNLSTIIVGVIQFIGNITSTICIDRCGRRILLIISSIGVAIGLTAFGCYTYITRQQDPVPYNWIPLVCMIFMFFVGSIGILSLPYVILVELLPMKIRATVLPICYCFLSVIGFGVAKVFPIYLHTFGISISMWSFGVITIVLVTYLIVFLPETKGKSIISD